MPSNSSSAGAVGADFGRAAGGGRRAESSCAHETLEQTQPLPPDEVRRQSAGIRLLSLCGGPTRDDGLDVFVRQWGAEIDTYDLEISSSHDLVDEAVWQPIRAKLEDGFYHGGANAPPCGTFCGNRGFGPGPRVLRDEFPPGIYGRPGLRPAEHEAVRKGTVVALRCLESFRILHGQCKPSWFEQPKRRLGVPSLFKLTEALAVIELEGVLFFAFVQCELDARTTKPTEIMCYLIDFSMLPVKCTHEKVWWAQPWNGQELFASHPPLRGTEWMIPWAEWDSSMIKSAPPDGEYLTRSAAAYTTRMNRILAEQWVRGAVAMRVRSTQSSSMVLTGRWSNTLVAAHLARPQVSVSHRRASHIGGLTPPIEVRDIELVDTTVQRSTGLPRVHMGLPLRGVKRDIDLGPLYVSQSVVGGGW